MNNFSRKSILTKKLNTVNIPVKYLSRLPVIILVIIVYYLAGKFGLSLAIINASSSAVWAPTGISIAAFIIMGYRIWPAIFVGAFFVNFTTAGTIITSLGIASGNTLEGVAAAYLINRFIPVEDLFSKPINIFKYTFLAGIISTMISATIGVSTLALGGLVNWSGYLPVWTTWWLGDMGGALIIAPAILLWKMNYKFKLNSSKSFEEISLFIILIIVCILILGGLVPSVIESYPFLTIPPLIWIALRFGPRETATGIVILSGIAIWSTLNHYGPFMKEDPNQSLIAIQVYMGVIFFTVMPITALVLQHKRLEEILLRDITERKKTEEILIQNKHELNISLKEKQLLLKEIHHRVKNNLQIISSLISLQSQSISDEKILEIFNQSRNRIKTMALVHEKLYQSEDLLKINFSIYVDDLLSNLIAAYKSGSFNLNFTKKIEDIPVNIDEVIALGLILNELVTNSLKHAFKGRDTGIIEIIFKKEIPANIVLIVKDDGEGLPDNFDLHKINSLGLNLVTELVNQLNGKIEYNSNNGTGFFIIFPII